MKKFLIATLLALTTALPAFAVDTHKTKWNEAFQENVTVAGTLGVTGAQTLTGNTTMAGNATVGGTLGVTGAATFAVPLAGANITNAAKRVIIPFSFNSGGTLADGTTYRAYVVPGRACTITKINLIATTPTAGGTNTFKAQKGTGGNTMLSAASYDPTGLTADQCGSMTLTATGADLGITASGAGSGVYLEYVTGTQTTDAVNVGGSVEATITDY